MTRVQSPLFALFVQEIAQSGSVSVLGTEGQGFDSLFLVLFYFIFGEFQKVYSSVVEHWTFNPLALGSNPNALIYFCLLKMVE
jgi:hypothetical protein